ncbi:MAG: C2H2-type zinc finger protein [Candidatus Nanohaloarchaea archaeon]|nr:C2H2-type zinc finger protein [Candidatus Nanohaloarchaea archaeon]
MPKYVCDKCGEVFRSKEELEEHSHSSSGVSRLSGIELPDLSLKQIGVLFAVFLMSSLFLGTAFFTSSIGPSSQNSGGGPAVQGTNPPTGYTVRSASDIPQVPQSQIPDSAVTEEPLSRDTQVYLLTRPAVLLQYSCTGCSGTVQELSSIAKKYNSGRTWVYVAPYREMDSRIAVTGFRRIPLKLEDVDKKEIGGFICSSLRQRPVQCALQ